MSATVTVRRGEIDLTVVVRPDGRIRQALDEDGGRVRLTPEERKAALDLARSGVDETGR